MQSISIKQAEWSAAPLGCRFQTFQPFYTLNNTERVVWCLTRILDLFVSPLLRGRFSRGSELTASWPWSFHCSIVLAFQFGIRAFGRPFPRRDALKRGYPLGRVPESSQNGVTCRRPPAVLCTRRFGRCILRVSRG